MYDFKLTILHDELMCLGCGNFQNFGGKVVTNSARVLKSLEQGPRNVSADAHFQSLKRPNFGKYASPGDHVRTPCLSSSLYSIPQDINTVASTRYPAVRNTLRVFSVCFHARTLSSPQALQPKVSASAGSEVERHTYKIERPPSNPKISFSHLLEFVLLELIVTTPAMVDTVDETWSLCGEGAVRWTRTAFIYPRS